MCGIFGIYFSDTNIKADSEFVERCVNTMTHRGPDDSGIYVKNNIGLGHRRLSIIDLSGGHQPMFNEDNSIELVYNGEIYNYRDLYAELSAKGHVFKTKCDTEVIIHAYEEWGVEAVKKFNGMFAFVLWDDREKRFWVVRDRLGIKPLYYFWDGKIFLCASEIKALLASGKVKAECNEKVLDAYFSLGYVPGPQTMFRNIVKLNPGNFILLKGRNLKEIEYWDFADVEENNFDLSQAKEKVKDILADSVNKRLMSDVPLGVFLSGGLDSSAVTALMSEVVPGDQPIKTFTVSYDSKYKVGEDKYAKIVADRFKTEHHVFKLEPDDFFASIETLIEFAEEPIVEPAAIALQHISKLARQYAIVLLSGEGSDEVFGGYQLYDFMLKLNGFSRFMPKFASRMFKMLSGISSSVKIKKYADWLSLPVERCYQGTSSYLTGSIKKSFYSDAFMAKKSNYLEETFDGYFEKVKHKKYLLNKLLYVDTKTWLADDLLVKADKMTMSASVELRVPFLDHRLVELGAKIGSSAKICNGQGKFVLKKIMERYLPKEIIYRQKKGFPVPTQNWFSEGIFKKIKENINDNIRGTNYFDRRFVDKMLNEQNNNTADHSKLLMMLLVFNFWREKHLNS